MKKKDLEQLKKSIDENRDIEDIHHQLQALEEDDVLDVVSSMTNQKVSRNVNMRLFQNDYICDYLEFLRDISEAQFWRHVLASFNLREGLLWSDNMVHCRKIQEGPIPDEVWTALIGFSLKVHEQRDVDALVCVIKPQLEYHPATDIYAAVNALPENEQEAAMERANYLIDSHCTYMEF